MTQSIIQLPWPSHSMTPILKSACSPRYPRLLFLPLVTAGSMAATIIALKICESYNPAPVCSFKLKMTKFQRDYPAAPAVTLIFFTLISILSISLGVCAGAAFGIYAGCRFEVDKTLRQQELAMQPSSKEKPFHQLALS